MSCKKVVTHRDVIQTVGLARELRSAVERREVVARMSRTEKERKKAAFLNDVMAHVTAKRAHHAVPLWGETRLWDPGD